MVESSNVQAIYEKAVERGRSQGGELAVLDEILAKEGIKTPAEYKYYNVQIPLDQIDGTKTAGRKEAFSSGFMPLLEDGTEFASKWKAVCEAHLEEGLRDPIIAYEYKNRFYVQEGNKRTSVLRYFDAAYVYGDVIRIIPPRTNDLENIIYYEYMEFYKLAEINYIYFKTKGSFAKLQKMVGKAPDEAWTDDDRMDFKSVFTRFTECAKPHVMGVSMQPYGEMLLDFMTIYKYSELKEMTMPQMKNAVDKYWEEAKVKVASEFGHGVDVKTAPSEVTTKKKSLIRRLFTSSEMHLTVGFLFAKTPQESSWTNMHELGRLHLEDAFPDEVTTKAYYNVNDDNETEMINQAIADGCRLIFTTTPNLLDVSVRAAMDHPEVTILNCSLNKSSKYVRTYYARMYEAKFIMGAIAGSFSENGKIGYLADYPVYGSAANINAFALGAKMVNPRARIYLKWMNLKKPLAEDAFKKHNIQYVSGRDSIRPNDSGRQFGLYTISDGLEWNVAMPIWNWGSFYEQMIRNIMNGSYGRDGADADYKGVNYWWGISSGVAEVVTSNHMPTGTRQLVDILIDQFANRGFNPFSGEMFSQSGPVHDKDDEPLTPNEIIKMEWLCDNVVGSLPSYDELTDEAQELIKLQGLKCLGGEEHL